MKTENTRHLLDIGSILRKHGGAFLADHKLCSDQLKAYQAIYNCRTAEMGGHIDRCDQCGYQRVAYNSCRNRNCNKCQYTKQLQWIDKLQSNLLVCPYFHVVFTIPEGLHSLFYINQRVCYKLLFQAAWQSLQKLARNPQFLAAQPGAVAVLHTWGQTLTYHPHIHMLVPAGGLSEDGREWIRAHKKFLVPVKVLSKVFRGVFWSLLEKQLLKQKVKLPDDIASLSALKQQVYKKDWNVYAKKPLGSSKSAVEYLGKYTHRVAISNSRLIKMEEGKISFKWKDYRTNGNRKLMTLSAEEFIRRFMQHILPSGFYKIRYYGLLASANGAVRQHCASLIGRVQPVALLQGLPARLVFKIVSGNDPDCCPKCKQGKMIAKTILDPV